MIPELGNFALMVATAVALVLGTLPVIGAARGNLRWMALARPAARLLCFLVVVASGCLFASLLGDDFSVHLRGLHVIARLAGALQAGRLLGRARGLDAALAADA